MEQMMFFKDSTTIQPNGAYHITERRALAQILSEGLRPHIGKRSEKAHENKPLIYITDGIDLPQWILIFTKLNRQYKKMKNFIEEFFKDNITTK